MKQNTVLQRRQLSLTETFVITGICMSKTDLGLRIVHHPPSQNVLVHDFLRSKYRICRKSMSTKIVKSDIILP